MNPRYRPTCSRTRSTLTETPAPATANLMRSCSRILRASSHIPPAGEAAAVPARSGVNSRAGSRSGKESLPRPRTIRRYARGGMVRTVAAIVLWTARPAELEAFYRGLGFPLREERHDDGPPHWACELGGVHFAIYPQEDAGDTPPEYRTAGASLIGFQVDSLDDTYLAAKR